MKLLKSTKRLRAEAKKISPNKSKRLRAEALKTAEEEEADQELEVEEPQGSDTTSDASQETLEMDEEREELAVQVAADEDSAELAKAKADYRADESIKEAGNALSAWVTKFKASSVTMNWSDSKALEMAAQYAGLCADLHGRTASYYADKCTNKQDAQKGTRWHQGILAQRCANDLEDMKALKGKLVSALKKLKGLYPEGEFKVARNYDPFPLDQDMAQLRRGLETLRQEANSAGEDPVKRLSLKLADDLNSKGLYIMPKELLKLIDSYFGEVTNFIEEEVFFEEFYTKMVKEDSNHGRMFLEILKGLNLGTDKRFNN